MALAYQTVESRWQALVEKDTKANGHFFYAVKTTGIFCLPSCRSRRPLRKNVVFFESVTEAQNAGFRPCKRCGGSVGKETHETMIAAACRLIENSLEPPSLHQLAAHFNLSAYYFHRIFKRITGITPKAYAKNCRNQKVKQHLQDGTSVTDALYEAGFQASSRFYEAAGPQLGMSPSQFKKGGVGLRIAFQTVETTYGPLVVGATEKGVCYIHFVDQSAREDLVKVFPEATVLEEPLPIPQWLEAVKQTVQYGKLPAASLPLDIQGTAFQQQVWQALKTIPRGTTASYAEVAQAIDKPKAVRAVANAIGKNNHAVVIPCHRVICSDGSLGGYRWGKVLKQKLLDGEQK